MATLTNYIITCDAAGCEEEVSSIRSLEKARLLALNLDWHMGDLDLCHLHAHKEEEAAHVHDQ